MDEGLTVPKWGLIVWPKITPNDPKCIRPVYFYLFGRNRTGIVQIVLGKVRKFRAA